MNSLNDDRTSERLTGGSYNRVQAIPVAVAFDQLHASGGKRMQFVLTGFTQDTEFRVFEFEGVKADRTRAQYTVRADLGLVRKYGIRVQELPLLCRVLLDKCGENEEQRALIFSEDDMQLRAKDCAQAREIAAMRKTPRRSSGSNFAAAPHVQQP